MTPRVDLKFLFVLLTTILILCDRLALVTRNDIFLKHLVIIVAKEWSGVCPYLGK